MHQSDKSKYEVKEYMLISRLVSKHIFIIIWWSSWVTLVLQMFFRSNFQLYKSNWRLLVMLQVVASHVSFKAII